MNKVVLIGRLTRDPMVSYSNTKDGQMCVARYTMAVDRRTSGDQTADFISCVAFGKRGEFAEKYLKQGTKIAVYGHIQTGSYTNKDGNKIYTTDVVIDSQEFVEKKADQDPIAQDDQRRSSEKPEDGFMNIADGVEDEGLPFN